MNEVHATTMDTPALAALVNLIAVLADNKYFLGRRLSEWATGAPSLEAAVACAALSQEELGQARALHPLLSELPWPGAPKPLEREGDRSRRYSVSYLDEPFPDWTGVVAALALVDTAVYTVFESLLGCRYEALTRRVRRAYEAERFHLGYAEDRVRELRDFKEGVPRLQKEVDRLLPEMLCWFGPQGEAGVESMRAEGLLAMDNEALRRAYLRRVIPLLLEAGLRLPVRWNLPKQEWEYEELPWDRWNPLQRRLEAVAATQKP